MKVRLVILLILVCATLILISNSITSANSKRQESQQSAQRKIASWVMEHTADGQEAEFLVILADKANLSAAKELPTKREKGSYVRDTLMARATRSQLETSV